jgi:hypothetical protein
MVLYDRGKSEHARIVGEFDDAVSWMAHPEEEGKRGSHAISTDEGVWILDPIDAPNVYHHIDALGDVVGVAVLSAYHARDAGHFARRYGVSVSIPEWMNRVEKRVDAPVQRYTNAPGDAATGFTMRACRPFPGWQEAFLFHEQSATLFVPDSLGTSHQFLLGDEQLGVSVFRRLQPPTQLRGLDPDRIFVGHGEPFTDGAASALANALDGTRRSFPKALLENGTDAVRSGLGAFRD